MEKWDKQKAKEWYARYPWIRGFNYVPSSANHRIEFYQEYGWETQKETIERELSLAHKWGFNAIRIFPWNDFILNKDFPCFFYFIANNICGMVAIKSFFFIYIEMKFNHKMTFFFFVKIIKFLKR